MVDLSIVFSMFTRSGMWIFVHHPQFQWNISLLGSTTKIPPRLFQVDTTSKTFLEDLSCALKERKVEILLANTIMSLGTKGNQREPKGCGMNMYPLVNKLVDPENHQVWMETFVFQPRWLPGSMLIYVNLPEGNKCSFLDGGDDVASWKRHQAHKGWFLLGCRSRGRLGCSMECFPRVVMSRLISTIV